MERGDDDFVHLSFPPKLIVIGHLRLFDPYLGSACTTFSVGFCSHGIVELSFCQR